jgi:signal transduction histidine kinase
LKSNGQTEQKLYEKFDMHAQISGIGLYTVRSKVEALGGIIGVSPLPKNGTEFRIELPLQ